MEEGTYCVCLKLLKCIYAASLFLVWIAVSIYPFQLELYQMCYLIEQ